MEKVEVEMNGADRDRVVVWDEQLVPPREAKKLGEQKRPISFTSKLS